MGQNEAKQTCTACGGELMFVQRVGLEEISPVFPGTHSAHLYLCTVCRKLELYEAPEDPIRL